MLNIDTEQTDVAPSAESTAEPAEARRLLEEEVLREVGARNAGERLEVMKRWHQGALSLIHLYVLTVLEAEGSLSMGGLAEALDVSVASTTGIVDRMEKRGLVERQHVASDRRVVLVNPTDEGLRTIDEFEGAGRTRLGWLLQELTDEEVGGFLLGIRALRAAGRRVFGSGADEPTAKPTPKPTAEPGPRADSSHVSPAEPSAAPAAPAEPRR
ncbi:MAG TPA: MarR family transcriptional regulator [Candidatus Saccharimonadales bacterium]|nr:MarR family transcriptional regulator [Candidatus Saccharimonadales bacterium]